MCKLTSWEGPAAACAVDIAKYVTIQRVLQESGATAYHDIITNLCDKKIQLSIPVNYVKVRLT